MYRFTCIVCAGNVGSFIFPYISLINRHLLQCIASAYCNMYIMCVINIVTYQYQIIFHGIRWRLSACANSVYQALSLLPLRAWERG